MSITQERKAELIKEFGRDGAPQGAQEGLPLASWSFDHGRPAARVAGLSQTQEPDALRRLDQDTGTATLKPAKRCSYDRRPEAAVDGGCRT